MIKVDVVRAQTLEAMFEGTPDVCRRKILVACRVKHADLGGYDHVRANGGEARTEHLFAVAESVKVRSVKKIDAGIECMPQRFFGFAVIRRPVGDSSFRVSTDSPRAKTDFRYAKAGRAKCPVLHPV